MKDLKHILIIEPEISGHQSDYIRLLISFFIRHKNDIRLSFVVSSGIFERLKMTKEMEKAINRKKLAFIMLSDKETAGCMHKILWIRALYRWFMATKYCKKFQTDHIHFLFIDHMQLPLALHLLPPKGVKVSGILLRPSVHYKKVFGNSLVLKEKIRDARKYIVYRLMLKNPKVSLIFSLDEYFALYANKHLPNGEKVHYLPDPSLLSSKDRPTLPQYALTDLLPQERKIFLLFGALDKRKGIFEALEALTLLEDRISRHIAVVFAGKIHTTIRAEFMGKIKKYLKLHKTGACVYVEDKFLSKNELAQLLKKCDTLLIPYQRHVGSSGLLVWAASARKQVITQDFGLIGELVKKYKLGQAVNTTQPAEIAKAVQQVVDGDLKKKISEKEKIAFFLKRHSPEKFSKKFFDAVLQNI